MTFLARFTPSLLDGDKLERLFVNREPILADGVYRIADAASTGRLAHVLYTGPRGAGKTHLVSLIHHRAASLPGYGRSFAMAWLDEDPWGITDYDAFMAAIDDKRAPGAAPLTVVIAEGFDRILNALGPDGQRSLRARVEREADLLLITTATRLSSSVIEQDRPFYGFFDNIELAPFTLDEATAMLRRTAEVGGDVALARRLGDTDVQARLTAVGQLTGGQPRTWALLSTGLTVDNLADMVDLLLATLDDLTPYYQSQLETLSGNELRIVLALLKADHALTGTQIADATGVSLRTVTSTAGRLRPMWLEPRHGWLQQYVDQRLTYYQLVEPLTWLVPQLKVSRGEPIGLVVDFLTAWYSRKDLISATSAKLGLPGGSILGRDSPIDEQVQSHLLVAGSAEANDLSRQTVSLPVVDLAGRVDDALRTLQHDLRASEVLALPSALAATLEAQLETTPTGLLRMEIVLIAVLAGGGAPWIDRAVDAIQAVPVGYTRQAQVLLACAYFGLGQDGAALTLLRYALAADHSALSSDEWRAIARSTQSDLHRLDADDFVVLVETVAPYMTEDSLPELVNAVLLGSSRYSDDYLPHLLTAVKHGLGAATDTDTTSLYQLVDVIETLAAKTNSR